MVAAAKSKARTAATKGGGGGGGGRQLQGEVRKGPWTEQEDVHLVWFVRLLGERRWDFLAKVSGLNRTGKSCRLRWVNYLHPGLKRGRMTPDEERLVVQLHAKWSRIAKSMPGRTDNEIKNYWRTHMRKQAQHEKATRPGSGSGSTTTSMSMSASPTSSSSSNNPAHDAVLRGNCDEEEEAATAASQELYTSMDLHLWNDIDSASYVDGWGSGAAASMPSPVWEYCSDSLWGIDDDE